MKNLYNSKLRKLLPSMPSLRPPKFVCIFSFGVLGFAGVAGGGRGGGLFGEMTSFFSNFRSQLGICRQFLSKNRSIRNLRQIFCHLIANRAENSKYMWIFGSLKWVQSGVMGGVGGGGRGGSWGSRRKHPVEHPSKNQNEASKLRAGWS